MFNTGTESPSNVLCSITATWRCWIVYFGFSIWRNMKQKISLNGRKIRKRPSFFFFCKWTWEKLIQVESPYNQTPLNYANPHAQVIVSSHLSPPLSSFPMRTQRRIKGARRNVAAGSYFDILKNLFLFFFWVLMRNGRNGISFCTF